MGYVAAMHAIDCRVEDEASSVVSEEVASIVRAVEQLRYQHKYPSGSQHKLGPRVLTIQSPWYSLRLRLTASLTMPKATASSGSSKQCVRFTWHSRKIHLKELPYQTNHTLTFALPPVPSWRAKRSIAPEETTAMAVTPHQSPSCSPVCKLPPVTLDSPVGNASTIQATSRTSSPSSSIPTLSSGLESQSDLSRQ